MFRLILKSLSYLASASLVLLASGFLTLRPVQHYPNVPTAQAAGPCSDFTQKPGFPLTAEIPNSDSGQFNFDSPGADWQACGELSKSNKTFDFGAAIQNAYFLVGWSWNTNFGDVSTFCEGGLNQGSGCGSMHYGSYILPDAPGTNTASISGFSWNDQIGWIKMSCENGTNTGIACGAQNYGAKIALRDGVVDPLGVCPNLQRGDIFGYVYNDTVGYMHMCGSHIDPTNFEDFPNPYDDAISAVIDFDPNGPNAPVGHVNNDFDTVYANGVNDQGDFYEIAVRVTETDVNGVPVAIDGLTANRSVVVTNTQVVNTVKTNQVSACNAPCAATAVSTSAYAPDNLRHLYSATVRSNAPTNEDNIYSLNTVSVQVFNENGDLLTTKILTPNRSLSFTPPVEVTHIAGQDGRGATLAQETFQLTPDQSTPIAVRAAKKTNANIPVDGAITVYTQLYSCNLAFDYIFDAIPVNGNNRITLPDNSVEDQAFTTNPAQPAGPLDVVKQGICAANGRFIDVAQGPLTNHLVDAVYKIFAKTIAQAQSADDVNSLAIQTVVSYNNGAQDIAYYSRALQDGSTSELAAKVEGNVNLSTISKDGLGAGFQNWISTAVGDMISSNREPYLRAVKAVLRGKTPLPFGVANFSGGGVLAGGEIKILKSADLPAGILHYKHDSNNGQHPCMIILTQDPVDDATPVTVASPTTLVTEGCNIFVDRNVVAAKNGQIQVGNLGIIALADYKLSGTMPGGKGGNVYVCNWVTDIEANIVAEGSLYGTATSSKDCGSLFINLRRTMLTQEGAPTQANMSRALLNRQLTIVGSLMSNNTYGGSKKEAPAGPLLGDGRIAKNNAEIALSAAQDLNRIRFGKVDPEVYFDEVPEVPFVCWEEGYVMSKLITDPPNATVKESCLNEDNTPQFRGTFNLQYRAPLPKQPIFNAL